MSIYFSRPPLNYDIPILEGRISSRDRILQRRRRKKEEGEEEEVCLCPVHSSVKQRKTMVWEGAGLIVAFSPEGSLLYSNEERGNGCSSDLPGGIHHCSATPAVTTASLGFCALPCFSLSGRFIWHSAMPLCVYSTKAIRGILFSTVGMRHRTGVAAKSGN